MTAETRKKIVIESTLEGMESAIDEAVEHKILDLLDKRAISENDLEKFRKRRELRKMILKNPKEVKESLDDPEYDKNGNPTMLTQEEQSFIKKMRLKKLVLVEREVTN